MYVWVSVCVCHPQHAHSLTALSLSDLTLIKTKRKRYKGYRNVCLYLWLLCMCVCVYVCACVCACVVGVLLRRLCVKFYHVFFFNHWNAPTILHAFLWVSFHFINYCIPLPLCQALSLSLTFFLSGFSLLCVILRNTHIHILYIVFIVLLLSHSCHSNTPCLFRFAYYS